MRCSACPKRRSAFGSAPSSVSSVSSPSMRCMPCSAGYVQARALGHLAPTARRPLCKTISSRSCRNHARAIRPNLGVSQTVTASPSGSTAGRERRVPTLSSAMSKRAHHDSQSSLLSSGDGLITSAADQVSLGSRIHCSLSLSSAVRRPRNGTPALMLHMPLRKARAAGNAL